MVKYIASIIWTIALLFLFIMDTTTASTSFCVFKWIGCKSCLGCGIGHAIHDVLHFNFVQSFKAHVLGLPATIGIFYTIFKPIRSFKNKSI